MGRQLIIMMQQGQEVTIEAIADRVFRIGRVRQATAVVTRHGKGGIARVVQLGGESLPMNDLFSFRPLYSCQFQSSLLSAVRPTASA
jgi:hypothetical protein